MEEENTGGLYKWTMDALFNRCASPSTKYGNNRESKPFEKSCISPERRRSCSVSGLDIFSKYDLLPDEEEPELLRPASVDSTLYHNQNTNTFNRRNRNSVAGIPNIRKTPSFEDPVVSRLFNVQDETNYRSKSGVLPGKFPSPGKHTQLNDSSFSKSYISPEVRTSKQSDYTSEYIRLMDKLTLNNKALDDLQYEVKTRQMQGMQREAELQRKYDDIRQELIRELKQSKLIYDNYSKLYHKYKDLKSNIAKSSNLASTGINHASSLQREALLKTRINELEAQIVDLTIDAERTRKDADDKILSAELQKQELKNKFDIEKTFYETKIKELEQKLLAQTLPNSKSNSIPSQSSSFFSNADDNSGSTASPYKEYNDTIDTRFLQSLVK